MDWNGRKVLVTGAGGFIGSHLTEELVRQGAEVTAFVRYNGPGRWGWLDESPHLKDIRIHAGDIGDNESVVEAMTGQEIVFHLAALIAIPYSYSAPRSYIRTNIEGTMNVVNAARTLGTQRIIHTSTSECYGTAISVPITEEHPLQGQSPYSASKIGADKIAESFNLSFGVPVVTVRPFNTFGPRQSARAVIPTIVSQLYKGEAVKLGSITPTRDLNYVSNTVSGFLAAAGPEAAIGQTINLGSNREISIGDLAHLIAKLMNKPVEIITDSQRVRPENSEVERLLGSAAKAKAILGWEPEISLEVGLTKTIDWMADHIAKYRPEIYAV
ncbi:MAG: SDR family NAD(P)-dependent oxidoreductase [Fimbriimonadaceae bacterium]